MKAAQWAMAMSCAIGVVCVDAAEPYVSYDGFSTSTLSPARWVEAERVRKVQFDGLTIGQRDWGGTAGDTGRGAVSFGDELTFPDPVTQIRLQIRVDSYDVTACNANPTPTRVRARVLGTFFNTGNGTPGSYVGDVLAQIWVARESNSGDAANVLKIQGSVNLCTSSDCSVSVSIGSVANLGIVNVGTTANVALEWDKAGKRFRFLRDAGATTVDVPYALSDSLSPARPLKSVGTRVEAANCLSGPRATGAITARFDSISINSRGRF